MYTITHRGVPVATFEVLPGAQGPRPVRVPIEPLPGFEAIRPTARAATIALRVLLAAVPQKFGELRSRGELGRAAASGRELELRDEQGALVPVDFIELLESPGEDPPVSALVRRRDAHAGTLAVERLKPRPAEGEQPEPPAA